MSKARQLVSMGAGAVFSLYLLYLLIKIGIHGTLELSEPNLIIFTAEVLSMTAVSIICITELWREI